MTPTPQGPVGLMPKSVLKDTNIWPIISAILAIALIGVIAFYALKAPGDGGKLTVIPADQATTDLLDFVNKIYGAQLGPVTAKATAEENGLYKVTVTINDQTGQPVDQEVYLSRDAKLFIPQVIKIEDALSQFETLQQQQQAAPQADVQPTPDPTPTEE